MTSISPLAFVNPNARLGNNVTIEPFAFIDEDTIIGDDCHIRAHASILAGARLGKNCKVYEGAIISASPQDFRWKGCKSFVTIGDNTTIREQVIINRSIREGMETTVGHDSFLMAQTHVCHDSRIGNFSVLGNSVKVAGDCVIGNYSILSSNVVVHENNELGDWVLIKGGCRVNGHVPPYLIMAHNPISYNGVNAFIMKKENFSDEAIETIAKCYRQVYQSSSSCYNSVRRILDDVEDCSVRNEIISFLRNHNYMVAALPKLGSD